MIKAESEYCYLQIIQVLNVVFKDKAVCQVLRMRQSRTKFLHRELRSGRGQCFVVFHLDLPISAVDAPLRGE